MDAGSLGVRQSSLKLAILLDCCDFHRRRPDPTQFDKFDRRCFDAGSLA